MSRAESFKICNDYCRRFHNQKKKSILFFFKSQGNITDEGKGVEIDKGAHQEDGFGGSGLKGGYGGDIDPTTVLDPQCKYIP